jgi:hypothetical protein
MIALPIAAWCAPAPDFYSHYWIEGIVSVDAVPAANRPVNFYYTDPAKFVSTETDAQGRYRLNAYDLQYFLGVPLTNESVSYNVVVPPAAGETSGNSVSPVLKAIQGYIDQFFSILSGQQAQPKLISYWPNENNGDIASTTPTITLTFSKTMNVSSVIRAVGLPALVPFWSIVSDDKNTFYFIPVGGALPPRTPPQQYKVTVSQAASDESGNSLDSRYSFTFNTHLHTTPSVVRSKPLPGEAHFPRLTGGYVLFSEAMNRESVARALSLPDAGAPWDPHWGNARLGGGSTINFAPHAPLAANTDYTLSVSTAATNLSGEALAHTYIANFRTSDEFIGPEVITLSSGVGLPPTDPVWVVFSEPIDPSTLPANIDLIDSSGNPVPGSFSYDSSTSTVNYIPNSPLQSLQEYTVHVRKGITDQSYHLPLRNPVTSLLIIADAVGPQISHVWFDGRGFVDNDIISANAQITAEVSDPSGLDYSDVILRFGDVMAIDKNSFKAQDAYSNNRLSYKIWPSLPEGNYVMTIEAYDVLYNKSLWQGRVRVFSGETMIVPGTVPFASPSSISPLKASAAGGPPQVTMVYQLTTPGNIDLQVQGISGMSWARRYSANLMGGMAGYNEVTWDGKDNGGSAVANGVYTFRIINNGRLLGKGYIIVYE